MKKEENKKIVQAEKEVKKEESKVEEDSLANGVSDAEVSKILAQNNKLWEDKMGKAMNEFA